MQTEYIREEERAKRLIAMGQMAASLAHEIRNPLGSMELYCTLLKKDLANLPSSLELAEQIHAGIKTLDRVINNCLQFARGSVPRRRKMNDAKEIFQETAACLQHRVQLTGAILSFQDSGSHSIFADPYLINQALLNLIINALDACQAGQNEQSQPVVEILSDRSRNECWTVIVKDNGPGIPSAELEKIFDPFFSTKNGGTGLGLAIVHSIAAAHRGSIIIESEEGKGTLARLELPGELSSDWAM